MKNNYLHKILTISSIALLLISLTQKAYCVDGNCGENWSGLMCFLLGIFSLIFSLSGISWLLNPLMIISYFIPKRYFNTKLLMSLASFLFGLSFLLFDEIIKDEAGHYGKITGYESGYWIWLSSSFVNLIGIILIKKTPASNDSFGKSGR